MSFTPNKGYQSNSNNSTTALGSAATFTGTGEQNGDSDVMVSCFADAAGTLYFEFSVNNTDWQTYPPNGFSISSGEYEIHTAAKGPRYFRVRFVNGSTAQTTFRLFTYFGNFKPSIPLNAPLGPDGDSLSVRPSMDWLDISRGLRSGIQGVKKIGRNDSVGTTLQPVSIGAVYQMPQAASATTLRIKAGGNANDAAAGSGARQITLNGLDENFNFVSETLATAGASASTATSSSFTRLFDAWVSESGTYASSTTGSHSGSIVVEDSGGTNDWLTIDSTVGFALGQSEIGAYSVPQGKTAHVFLRRVSADTGKTIDLLFFERLQANQSAAPYSAMRFKSVINQVDGGQLSNFPYSIVPFGPFQGPCDLGFMCKVSSGSAEVSVEFEIIEVEE